MKVQGRLEELMGYGIKIRASQMDLKEDDTNEGGIIFEVYEEGGVEIRGEEHDPFWSNKNEEHKYTDIQKKELYKKICGEIDKKKVAKGLKIMRMIEHQIYDPQNGLKHNFLYPHRLQDK